MSFLSKYKKEIILGIVMAAGGAVLFFAGGYLIGEQIPLPSFDQKEAVEEEKTAEDIPEEKPDGETAEKETPAPEVVNAGGEKETVESPAENEKPEERAQEEAAAEEKPAAPSVSAEETENAAPESVQSGERQDKEEPDPEAEKRRAEGRFIGQIDAIIAAEDAWNAYPGQIPEGYDSRSGYTYDTYISKDPTPEEPWYEITLCISNHRDDTKIDKRAIVDAYTGKVKE